MRLSRNFAYNLAGAGLPLLLAAVAVPVIGGQAGYDRLGFLTIAWAVIGYVGFLDLGLSRVFARRIAVAHARGRLHAEADLLRWTTSRLMTLCVVVAALAGWLVPAEALIARGAGNLPAREVQGAWLMLVAGIPAVVLSNVWRGALEGREAFGTVNVIRVLTGAWTFGAPLAVLPFSSSLIALVGALAAGRWLSLLLHGLACRRVLPRRLPATATDLASRRAELLATLREGAWITASTVVGPLMVVFDRFALGALSTLGAVAVYAVPQELVLRLLVVPGMLATTLYPRLAVLSGMEMAAGSRLAERGARFAVLLLAPACLGTASLAEPLFDLWMGHAFSSQAAPILQVLMVGCVANASAQVAFAHVQSAGRAWQTARIHLLELLPYLAALWWAAHAWGAVGAAWVWSARCVIDAVAMHHAAARLSVVAFSPRLAASVALATAALLALALARPPMLACIIVAVVAGSLVVGVGIDRQDRSDLASLLRGWLRLRA